MRELDEKVTASAGEEWKYLSGEKQYNNEKIYQEVFEEIWSQRRPEWRKLGRSFPNS